MLNLGFAVLELVGGTLTGSVAVLSNALHDIGDAAGIDISLVFEKNANNPMSYIPTATRGIRLAAVSSSP